MTYKGTVASYSALPSSASKGDTYVLSADDGDYRKGDMFIWNGSAWDRIPAGDAKVTDLNPTLVHGVDTSIATIDGITIHAKVEAETWRAVQVNGTEVIANSASTALNVSDGNYIKFSYNNSKLTADASFVSMADGSNGYHGIADVEDVATVIKENEEVVANSFAAVKTSVGLTDSLGVDWDGKFTEGTDIVTAIKDLSTDLAAIDIPAVSYTAKVTSSTTGSVDLGTITVGTSTYEVYGKDTVYVHPAKPTTGSAATGNASTASATTVLSGVAIDASGHVANIITSDISAAYNQRAVAVNGETKIATTATTTLDISAGKNVTVEYTNSKVVISAADNTDEKVLAEASEAKAYLLGQLDTSVGTANKATYDTDVYATAGALHATSLYEGTWSVHDSSAGDWGTIE